MTIEQAAKILAEKMGECWHEKGQVRDFCHESMEYLCLCPKCGNEVWWSERGSPNPIIMSSDFWMKVWTWAKGEEWWFDFLVRIGFFPQDGMEDTATINKYIGSPDFLIELAEFIERRKQ